MRNASTFILKWQYVDQQEVFSELAHEVDVHRLIERCYTFMLPKCRGTKWTNSRVEVVWGVLCYTQTRWSAASVQGNPFKQAWVMLG